MPMTHLLLVDCVSSRCFFTFSSRLRLSHLFDQRAQSRLVSSHQPAEPTRLPASPDAESPAERVDGRRVQLEQHGRGKLHVACLFQPLRPV